MKSVAAAVLMIAVSARGQGKPEQIDVPPIQEEYGNPGTSFCDMGACTWIDYDKNSGLWGDSMKPHRRTRLTCADKTRFLMTSEDGIKHCILLIDRGGK